MSWCTNVRVWLNVPDRRVSLDCECRYVQHDGPQLYDNLYIAPSLCNHEDDKLPTATGSGVWIAHDEHQSMRHKLSPEEKGIDIGKILLEATTRPGAVVVAFQIPKQDGFVAHADPWAFRVADSASVLSTRSFLTPLGRVTGHHFSSPSASEVKQALDASAGAVISSLAVSDDALERLDFELRSRLSFPWLSPTPPKPRRVCFVCDGELSITATSSRWEAAIAMGIKTVVLSSGTWWEDDTGPHADLREGFISVDMTPGPTLSQRITDAVKAYPEPIDGIFTVSDGLLVPVAEAAVNLGLMTNNPRAYTIATNKYLTRCMANPTSSEYFKADSLEALEARLASSDVVRFPVVCKPFRGRGSEGVYKADNPAQLRHAFGQALASKNGVNVLVEAYVKGPEVDCNLVLLEGQLLYAEVVDDFPSPADVAEDAKDTLFAETEAVIPSRLPQDEQQAIIDYVFNAVRKQGFHTGVFHGEARVSNSSMDYVLSEGSAIPELELLPKTGRVAPSVSSVFLHEVNARIPGIASSFASLLARGIDFWALQVLCAVGDWPRYVDFTTPFTQDRHSDHVWLTNASARITLKGVGPLFPGVSPSQLDHRLVDNAHNPIRLLANARPDLTEYVLRHNANVKDGVKYGLEEGEWMWIACIVISSPISRQHARSVAEGISDLYPEVVRSQYYIL